MAQRVDNVDFSVHARTKYPWSDWTDGSTWQITRAEDYPSCDTASMKGHLYATAYKQDLKVNVRQVDEETLVFRFKPLDETTEA